MTETSMEILRYLDGYVEQIRLPWAPLMLHIVDAFPGGATRDWSEEYPEMTHSGRNRRWQISGELQWNECGELSLLSPQSSMLDPVSISAMMRSL